MWQLLSSVNWLSELQGTLKTALGAGFGASAAQWFFTWRREQRERGERASYLAVRVAVHLEAYARECANFLQVNANAPHLPGQEFPEWETTLPVLPPYPSDDLGWRSKDRRLVARAEELREHIAQRQDAIRSTIDYNIDELGERLDEHAAALGLEALQLAKDLRAKYRLGQADPLHDVSEWLRSHSPQPSRKASK